MKKQIITIEREVEEFVEDDTTRALVERFATEDADPMRATTPRVSVVSEPIPEPISDPSPIEQET